MEVSGQLQAPVALPPEKNPGTHCTGGWVGPSACLDVFEKAKIPCPCRAMVKALKPQVPQEGATLLTK
jgi:hypothetical protein